ncbi:MAG: homoserine dehydrogenase [Candidatus Gracilibacteria bacterium]|jgi:homoserine dehydrogenase|nr:homoserine dehydrogenase [Candidatus Gracilibacteria bacterium]MDD5179478.1 homoserine dehydrogenase [Candidatus Gracilibacteria bacterium]
MKTIKVGIIGCGVVGSGVVRVLQENAKVIELRVGSKIEIAGVADRVFPKGVKIEKKIFTSDGFALCRNPEIDIIVETVGGMGIAAEFIKTALENGKHVITANKALLSEKGFPLFQLASQQKKLLLFEAAVGGAIPIIRTLKMDFAGEKITQMKGILNGTCNYILTQLTEGGIEFADALKAAQEKGYAEADPTLDIEGIDTAHKIALMAMLAWGVKVDFKKISITGITGLTAADFDLVKRLGFVIKLIAFAKKESSELEIHVSPTLLPADSALAKIGGVINAVQIYGKNMGSCLLSGRGAGSLPTATAVVGDIIEAARDTLIGKSAVPVCGYQPEKLVEFKICKIEESTSAYYLRFSVKDLPGVIRDISTILAKHNLSIHTFLQFGKPHPDNYRPIAMVLHPAKFGDVKRAVVEIDKLKCVDRKTLILRVEM